MVSDLRVKRLTLVASVFRNLAFIKRARATYGRHGAVSYYLQIPTNLLFFRFCTGLAYYTFSQYLGFIGKNIFMTVAISGLISTPGALLCVFIITRFGRKTTIGTLQVLTGLCFVFILMIPKNSASKSNDWLLLVCAGIGMAGMAVSISLISWTTHCTDAFKQT